MGDVGVAARNFVGPGEVPDAPGLLHYAERAEALGYESIWVWDHLLLGVDPAFPILDSLSLLASFAARTERLKLGTGVLVLSLRNPVIAAKVLATIDQLSSGRLIVGVAAGWYEREFDAAGVPFRHRGRLLDRDIELVTTLWAGQPTTFQDERLNLRSAVLRPTPLQRPRPPILVGGYVDAALQRAARIGDGWLTYFYKPDSVARSIARIRAYASGSGRDLTGFTVTNQVAVYVAEHEEAAEEMRTWLTAEWDLSKGSESTFDHAIVGSAEACVGEISAQFAAGVDRIIVVPYRYQTAQIDRIAREVLPSLSATRSIG